MSWIPSEAVTGSTRVAFDSGLTHYDDPRPANSTTSRHFGPRTSSGSPTCSGLGRVGSAGQISGAGYSGGGLIGDTTIRLGGLRYRSRRSLPDPAAAGARPGLGPVRADRRRPDRPARAAARQAPPVMQWQAPLVWTTLSLTLHADGTAETTMTGASKFPRHWVYNDAGA